MMEFVKNKTHAFLIQTRELLHTVVSTAIFPWRVYRIPEIETRKYFFKNLTNFLFMIAVTTFFFKIVTQLYLLSISQTGIRSQMVFLCLWMSAPYAFVMWLSNKIYPNSAFSFMCFLNIQMTLVITGIFYFIVSMLLCYILNKIFSNMHFEFIIYIGITYFFLMYCLGMLANDVTMQELGWRSTIVRYLIIPYVLWPVCLVMLNLQRLAEFLELNRIFDVIDKVFF